LGEVRRWGRRIREMRGSGGGEDRRRKIREMRGSGGGEMRGSVDLR
jgi:hypothetical protein